MSNSRVGRVSVPVTEQPHRLVDPQPVGQRRRLQLAADQRPQPRPGGPRVQAEYPHAAAVGSAQTLQALHGGRLARPVDAEDAEDLTLGHREPDVVDGQVGAVTLHEPLHLDHRRSPMSSPRLPRDRIGGRRSRRPTRSSVQPRYASAAAQRRQVVPLPAAVHQAGMHDTVGARRDCRRNGGRNRSTLSGPSCTTVSQHVSPVPRRVDETSARSTAQTVVIGDEHIRLLQAPSSTAPLTIRQRGRIDHRSPPSRGLELCCAFGARHRSGATIEWLTAHGHASTQGSPPRPTWMEPLVLPGG